MFTFKEDTALIGIAELRTKAAEILKKIKKYRIILTKRNKPVGMIIDYDEYLQMQRVLDEIEDIVLGNIAKDRLERKGKKFITLDEAEEKVGLK